MVEPKGLIDASKATGGKAHSAVGGAKALLLPLEPLCMGGNQPHIVSIFPLFSLRFLGLRKL